jgi:hypothetical protein
MGHARNNAASAKVVAILVTHAALVVAVSVNLAAGVVQLRIGTTEHWRA